ncbi:hypothetical protein Tco_0597169 [Tanacetum coccineum]
MQDKKPDLSFFHVFGALCYPTTDNDDLGKLDAKSDIAMASEQFSSGPGLHYLSPATSSSGLVPNTLSQQPCIPPNKDDWDHFFQPMFNEHFTPPSIVVSLVQEATAPRAVDLAESPVSTSIDQDAPSSSNPSTQEQEQSPNISQGFEESSKTPTFHDDPLNKSPHEESTPQGSSSNVRQTHTSFEHLGKWTKDHPIANVIGDPSRSVSTRKQLQTDAMWCYFDAFLTSVEPKNFKQAMTERLPEAWLFRSESKIFNSELKATRKRSTSPGHKLPYLASGKETRTLHTKTLKDSFMLRTSLDDITKNIRMEYLPKRRWSTLEKKRANIMIKAIDKQLKERSQNRRDLPRDIPLDSVEVLRFSTIARNPVKEILLKLNLPDHRSILTDSKEYIKMDMEGKKKEGNAARYVTRSQAVKYLQVPLKVFRSVEIVLQFNVFGWLAPPSGGFA